MICAKPFHRFGISAQSYFFCCLSPLHSMTSYYNIDINETTLSNIWFNVGKEIRDEMLNRGYESVCCLDKCPAMIHRPPLFLPRHELTIKQKENWEKLKYLQEGAYPNEIEITLGLFCNMRCIHCSQQTLRHNNNMFLLNLSDKIKEELIDFLSYSESVILIGGEPTVSPIYYDMLNIIRKANGAKIRLSTNGLLIEQNIVPYLDIIRWIDISIDAASEEVYNKIRKGGDWKLLLRGLEKLSNYSDIQITINNVISIFNYHEMPQMIELASKYNTKVFFDYVRDYKNNNLGYLFLNYFNNTEHKKELDRYVQLAKEKANELKVQVISFIPGWEDNDEKI